MRKSFLAAAAVFTLASATAMAQNATMQNDTTKTNPTTTMTSPPSSDHYAGETEPRHAVGYAEFHQR